MTNPRKTPDGRWVCRWYSAGRGSPRRQRTFDRKKDAELFLSEVRRRKALGELASLEAADRTVQELAVEWWRKYAVPNLADNTLNKYEYVLTSHIRPRLGHHRLRELTPEVLMEFRVRLEQKNVGRDTVRVSLVVLQAMCRQALAWGWLPRNPVRGMDKPTARRERAVVCLSPSQVESLREAFLDDGRLYAATLVSLVAYAGLRVPEEVLALEVRHIGRRTILVEQRNIDGKIIPGQKVRHAKPRTVDLLEPLREDIRAHMLRYGIREGLLFPGKHGAWRRHDVGNFRRRVWRPTVERVGLEGTRPYDLRHSFASLQIRAGLPVPDLAEQLGHSPMMTLSTYTHVLRELRGELPLSAEEQIRQAREQRQRRAM